MIITVTAPSGVTAKTDTPPGRHTLKMPTAGKASPT